ncbi:MAG: stressosome-associated protein Prli42 [Lysinibacillus sp.]|nr:stressosome-associated protein Prli42 [Lysinibacillus sp.]
MSNKKIQKVIVYTMVAIMLLSALAFGLSPFF